MFEGKVMHSHEYKTPEQFKGKNVCLLGGAASGIDLTAEIATVSASCYLVAKSHMHNETPTGAKGNIHKVTGTVDKVDGSSVHFDTTDPSESHWVKNIDFFVFCTGYQFHFPFLNNLKDFSTTSNVVYPLYKHLFYTHDPSLHFIGLPFRIIPFPLFEC